MNYISFEQFISTLQGSNRRLDSLVDWGKCVKQKRILSLHLNCLNYLLGKPRSDIKSYIELLFDNYKDAFKCLNILVAIHNSNEVVITRNDEEIALKNYFTSSEMVYEFMCDSGLVDIFCSGEIKDLNDFVFGIEVGLDSNARKNRSGKYMESLLENIFDSEKLNYKSQVYISEFLDINCFGSDKKFDFVLFTRDIIYFIECNFYSSGGSKLNEVARSYKDIANKFNSLVGKKFVWITDGGGWLSSKRVIKDAYNNIEIYNIAGIDSFIKKIKYE